VNPVDVEQVPFEARVKKEYSARVCISIPPELLKEFDEVARREGYEERSKAFQSAVRHFVDQSRNDESQEARAAGTILVLFDHTRRSVENITRLIHTFGTVVVSTVHVHLPEPNYLYIMVVSGRVADIASLEQRLRNLNGVIQLKITHLTIEEAAKSLEARLPPSSPNMAGY